MASEHLTWRRSRPLWFRLPRLLRIGWIFASVCFAPWQRRWTLTPEHIRVLLLVRDIHSPLPPLVESLLQQGILPQHIFLLDSGSTNTACLATLAALEQTGCRRIRLSPPEQRFGPYVPWLSPQLNAMIRSWNYPYLVSDPDLAFPATIPSDWLFQLFDMLNKHRSVLKVALPLAISDITVQNSHSIKLHEVALSRQPAYRLLSHFLLGPKSESLICTTDTTLALYRPSPLFSTFSIRLPLRYAITHLPWYDKFCSTPEFHYYQSHKLSLFGEWSSIQQVPPLGLRD
jgi:hypothetical protein